MVKQLTLGFADFETETHLDLSQQGIDVSIDGNELRDQHGNIPTVKIKCVGLIVKDRMGNEKEFIFHTIKEFLQGLIDNEIDRCYFHNLKFDDAFIASYTKDDIIQLDGCTVQCKSRLLGPMGVVYADVLIFNGKRHSITHKKVHKCEIWDSMKIWSTSLKSLGKAFGIFKGGTTHGSRALDIGCTSEMEEYCLQDCRVMKCAMEYYFKKCDEESNGSHPYGWMTAGSTSYHLAMIEVRKLFTTKGFNKAFPPCNLENNFPIWLREGYKGAVPLLDPEIKNKPLFNVLVFDVNSMYPDKLRNYPLPIGRPIKISDCTIDKLMDLKYKGKLWIAKVKMVAKVKPGHRATYLLKHRGKDGKTLCDMINDVNGVYDEQESYQVLTSADMDYILRDYDIMLFDVLECIGFEADKDHVFLSFIDKWYKIKEKATLSKNKPLKLFAKLILNSLYGKFGTNPEHSHYFYKFDGDRITVKEDEDIISIDEYPLYLPIAMFTTAYARDVISKVCNGLGWDHVAYTDTDSVHVHDLTIDEAKQRILQAGFKIDKTELGAFDFESAWGEALYVRNKGYFHFKGIDIETGLPTGETEIKMAGANGFNGFNCLEDVLDKELLATQKRGFRVNGGIMIMEKEVTVDTRIDPIISKKKIRGKTQIKSDKLLESRKENIWKKYGVIE